MVDVLHTPRLISNGVLKDIATRAMDEEELHDIVKRECSNPTSLIRIMKHEYCSQEKGRPDKGLGDFVLAVPWSHHVIIVEVKYVDLKQGRAARTRRYKSRKKVAHQATKYGQDWKRHHPQDIVDMYTFTNDRGFTFMRRLP